MRTPTQSLEVDQDDRPEQSSLAVGTSEAREREPTRIESPSGRAQPSKPPRDPLAEDPTDRLGEVLGTYKLAELLGKGGMGYVYRAEHTKLGREVALKLLRADYSRRRDAVLRFFQEAKTVNRVRHRNIVDVTDFVELDDGTTFIIMELLRGQSLGRWARTGVDLPRALAVLVQICDGLGAAHAVGVIHRDLKPDNVIVVPTSDGAELVKLLDFGVAKLLNRDDEDVGFQTAAGSVIGTPAYMSPEQAGGMVVDHRSDIYSLGAIMYELFCAQPMFKGRSFGEFVRKHLTEQPVLPHLTQAGANIDPRLEQLIMRALAKDPNERYGSIIELRDGMLGLLAGIETLPPQYMQTMQSGVRTPQPPPAMMPNAAAAMPTTMLPQSLPPHLLPLPAPAHTMLPVPQDPMAMGHVSAQYQQYSGTPYPTIPPRPASPWWLWAVGATAAVGLGIAGAVWYARSHRAPEPAQAPAQPTPTATALVEPAPPEPAQAAKPPLVELRFDSLPKAGVYVEGHSAELCRTPCTFNVNLGDGGPTDRRTFVVRADGYRDKSVEVQLASAQRTYSVTLDQLAGAEPAQPADDETATPVSAKSKKKTAGKHAAKSSEKKQSDKVEEAKTPDPEPTKPIEAPPPKPTEKKKATEAIDQTETVDPFRH